MMATTDWIPGAIFSETVRPSGIPGGYVPWKYVEASHIHTCRSPQGQPGVSSVSPLHIFEFLL